MNNSYQELKAVYENGDFSLYDAETSSFNYSNFWKLHTQIYDELSNSAEQIELLHDYKDLLFSALDTPFELALHLAVLSSLSACVGSKDLVFDTELIASSKIGSDRLLDFSKISAEHLKKALSLFTVLDELQIGSIDNYVFSFTERPTPYDEHSKFLSWILNAHPDIQKMVQLNQDIGVVDVEAMSFSNLLLHVIEIIESRTISYDLADIDIVYN